jgi:ABC-2 type transport system permease protein
MWFLIGAMIFLFQIAISGIIHDNEKVKQMLTVLDFLPSFIKTALGGDYLQAGNIVGLITVGYKHPFVLFLYMFYAVSVPTGLLAGEVQRGTMELILSRQVTKMQVYFCSGLITVAGMFALTMIMFLGTVAATHIYDFGKPVPLNIFFRIAIDGGLFASMVGTISLLCAAVFSKRNIAAGIAVTFLVVNYFISIISQWWPRMNFLGSATIFSYFGGPKLVTGWPVKNMCILAAIFLLSSISGAIIWKRRDLPL